MNRKGLALEQRCFRSPFDIVLLGASLGGLKAVSTVLSGLPADFPAAVVVAQHRWATRRSHLRSLLRPCTALQVVDAGHGVALAPGTVFLAPAGNHLLVEPGGRLALAEADRASLYRPSADLLFASAAEVYGSRAIGLVLTGKQWDGAIGSWALKALGGRVLAQDPATCEAAEMPLAAIRSGSVDFVVPLERIATVLVALVMAPGAAPLFRVPPEASLSRARRLWSSLDTPSNDADHGPSFAQGA